MQDAESDRLHLEFSAGVARAVLSSHRVDLGAMEMLANALTRLGRHHEALEIDRLIIGLDSKSGVAHYNLACSLAQLRQVDEAFDALIKAIALGFSDVRALANDPDLAGLRKDDRFKALLRRFKGEGKSWRS